MPSYRVPGSQRAPVVRRVIENPSFDQGPDLNVKVCQQQLIGRRRRGNRIMTGARNAALMPCWTCQAQTAAVIAATGCPRSFFVSDNDQLPPIRGAQYYAAIVSGRAGTPSADDGDRIARARAAASRKNWHPKRIRSATAPERRRRARGPSPSPHSTSRPQSERTRERRKIPLSTVARTRVRSGPRAGS